MPRVKATAGSVSEEDPLPGSQTVFSCVLTWWTGPWGFLGLLYKVTDPIMGAPPS